MPNTNKKLITAIITVCFLMESTGMNYPPSVAYANKDVLRPMAEANSCRIENATILPTTQQAISDIQDAIRKAWEAGIEYPTPIILFGSFADGYATAESDLDISVPLLDIDPYEPRDDMRKRWLNFVRFLKTALKLKGYKFDERPDHGTEGILQYDVGAMHILKTNSSLFKKQVRVYVISKDTVKSVNIGKRDPAPEANYLGTKSSSAGNKTAPISDVFIKLRHIYCEVRNLYHEQSDNIGGCIDIVKEIIWSNCLAEKPILAQKYNKLHCHLCALVMDLCSLDDRIRGSLMTPQEDLEFIELIRSIQYLYNQSKSVLLILPEIEEAIAKDKDLQDLKEQTSKVRERLEIFLNFIKNLLDSVKGPVVLKAVNLNEIIKKAGDKYGLGDRAEELVSWSLNSDLCSDERIENFPTYFESVWLKLFDNIFKNAVDHGLDYGINREDATINVVSRIDIKNNILIEISDNGKGMPRQACEVVDKKTGRQRVFTEEYSEDKTEKQPWRGLGLALCWDIVTMHGGKIKVHSKFGKGTTFLIHLPSAEKSRKDKRLDESMASQFYKKKEDQLEVSFIPQPLFSLRGRLTIKNSKFAINRKLIEWNEDTRGVFYTNLWQILLYLAKEQGLVDFGDSIDNDFLLDLLLAPIGGRVATIDEILYNVFFSYLTDEEASGCRAEIRRSPRDFFRMFFGLLAKRKLDIEIILEYYPKREGYPDVIQLKIVNNKTLSDRDRARIREAFNIFRQIQELQGRIRLLENRDIWTERTGRGLLGFVNYINKGCSIYRFREYPKRTEQVVRLIGSLAFFKKDFIEKLRQASWRKKYQEDIPNPKDDSIDDSPKFSSAGNNNVRFLRTSFGRPLRRGRKKGEVIEVNPKNGVKCIKEKDPKTGKYRHRVYIYPEGKYKVSSVEFKYDGKSKVKKINVSRNEGSGLQGITPFKVSRSFTFTALSDSERSSSGCEWAVVQLEGDSDIDRVYKFSARYFDKKGGLKEEKFYKLGLEATVDENLLSFAGIYASKFDFAPAIACKLLESVFRAVRSGRTLKEKLPQNSLIFTLGEIQNLRKVDQKIHRDLRELRWVDEHRDKEAEVKAEEKHTDTLQLLASLVGCIFRSACKDKKYIRYLFHALRIVSSDWAANVLLDPRELHLTLPKNPKAQMLVISEITSAIKGELWRRRGMRTRYDKFLLQYLFFWALEGDADFIIKLIRNIEGDSRSLMNIKLKEGQVQESWENILYLYALMALVSGVFGIYDLSEESLDFLFLRLGEFLEQTKDEGQTTDDSSLRGIGDKVQNIVGMLTHARDKRLYEYLITLTDHPLEKYMSENYPNLPVDFIAAGFGAIYPLLEKDKEQQRKIIEILIERLNHSNVWRALAAAEELAKIREPVCAKALLESYEKLRTQLQDKDIPVLNRIYTGLRNHRVLPTTLAMVSEEEAKLGRSNYDILSKEIDFHDRISKVTLEHLGVLRFIKDEVSKTLPDDLIEELADNFLYPDDKFKAESRFRVIELLQKFAYTESGYDEYATIYYLYKIRPIARRIRADLFIERFPEVSKMVNGAHALIGPIFLKLFGVNGSNRPIIPESRFHSQIVHMEQRMGTKERPGLGQIVDKVKNFGTNWPVLSAVASQMLLRGNIKEGVYMLGKEILDSLEGSNINYQPFVTLNNPDLVRKAYSEVVSGLGESEKTKLGSHLRNELNYSLGNFRRQPELFNIYADEIAAILSEFPFSDRSRVDSIVSPLIFPKRQGIEFRYIRRNFENFRLGDLVGDCTEISGTNFWSVPTFLAHPFYQTLLIYYDGQLVDKVDFTLIEKSGKLYLVIDAHEPVPQLDEKNESASPTLIDKREEIYLETINKIREIANAIGVAGIRAQGTSNRKYIEGVFRLLFDRDTGEERQIECIKPGLYEKYFGNKKDQQAMVRLLGGLDVIQRFVASMEEHDAPILWPLLVFKEGKPQILFQTTKSLTGKDKMLQLFGRTIERHLSIVRSRSGESPFQYPYKELDRAISELDFQKATELIFKNDDRMYRDLRGFVEQQADKIYAEVGKLPGTLEEKTRRALELTFGPSGVEGYAELYEIPLEPTEKEKDLLLKPAEKSGNTEAPLPESVPISSADDQPHSLPAKKNHLKILLHLGSAA